MTSFKIFVVSITYRTNTSHIAVRLFSKGLQKTLKCCKNISGNLGYPRVCHFFCCSYHVLMSSVTYFLKTRSNMEPIC